MELNAAEIVTRGGPSRPPPVDGYRTSVLAPLPPSAVTATTVLALCVYLEQNEWISCLIMASVLGRFLRGQRLPHTSSQAIFPQLVTELQGD